MILTKSSRGCLSRPPIGVTPGPPFISRWPANERDFLRRKAESTHADPGEDAQSLLARLVAGASFLPGHAGGELPAGLDARADRRRQAGAPIGASPMFVAMVELKPIWAATTSGTSSPGGMGIRHKTSGVFQQRIPAGALPSNSPTPRQSASHRPSTIVATAIL